MSAPRQVTWIIAVVVGILALLGGLDLIRALAGPAFWLAIVAFVILALATVVDGV
ncbi:MAG: hypothetical protein ACRDHL_03865 [Candidatus Promineifilaceae bacterium]